MYVKYVELFIKSLSPRHLVKLNCTDELFARGYGKDEVMMMACKYGNMKMVDNMINRGADAWSWGLFGACMGGSVDMIDKMIRRGACDWNDGLRGACLGGHMDIMEDMAERGADDWNGGLVRACVGENIDVVDEMIRRGANNCYWCYNKKHNFN